jgi:hypothetical protein
VQLHRARSQCFDGLTWSDCINGDQPFTTQVILQPRWNGNDDLVHSPVSVVITTMWKCCCLKCLAEGCQSPTESTNNRRRSAASAEVQAYRTHIAARPLITEGERGSPKLSNRLRLIDKVWMAYYDAYLQDRIVVDCKRHVLGS